MAGCSWGLRDRVLLLLQVAVGLSPLYCLEDDDSGSSLIGKQRGSLRFEDVDFGKYKLSQLNCGNGVQLDLVNRLEAPTVTFKEAKRGTDYLIAMIDPDAPYADNPSCQSWLHWIIGNIDGGDLAKGTSSSGETFTDYKPPSPPKPKPGKTNDHRYFIYIFEQEGKLDDSARVNERCRFNIADYKDKFNLKAVAMNMFKTHS